MSKPSLWTRRAVLVGLAAGVVFLLGAYSGSWKPTGLFAAATAPPLGSAGSYAVLAAAGVTNTGATVLKGDLGTHPTPAITGFFGTVEADGPGIVSPPGTVHQADAAALAARGALTTAYNNAAGQAVDFTIATDLVGQNLAPGVYASASGTFENSGTLTLTGTATDVWVFKMASTLKTAGSSVITMAGGALSKNVYWQVGSSADLGASSTFRGNILASTTISLLSGATVDGRLLAGALDDTGAVTLIANTVTAPLVPPTLGKGFLPVSIVPGGVSTLTIVLSNPNTNAANLTAPLIDTLPAGVAVAAVPAASTTCAGIGAVIAVAGTGSVTLPATRIIPGGVGGVAGSCMVTVSVTAAAAGVFPNTLPAGALTTSNGNNAAPVTATLTVVAPPAPPTLGKGFIPISIAEGGVSTLTIVLSNPNLVAATLTGPLVDTLPAGVVIAAVPAASTTCGAGVVTAVAGGATVTLTGGAIPLGIIGTPGTCTVTVSVTAAIAGVYPNTLAAGILLTSNGTNAAPVTATLTAVAPPAAPTLGKGFIPISIGEGGVSTLTIVLSNPNLVAATLTAPLIDTLPAGVAVAGTPAASTTCGAGVVTAAAGGAAVTLTGGAIPLGIIGTPGTCTVIVDVTGPVGGSYINTLAAGALTTSNGSNAAPVTATLTVVPPAPSGGGGGGGFTPPPPIITRGYVFLSSAFCYVEVCPFGQQQLQVGQPIYATFSLNRVPEALVRAEAYWNGAQYTSTSWPGPYTSIGPFTSSAFLGPSPDAGILEVRVWVGTTYVGAFSATVENPFVKGTCSGNASDCPQVVGPSSGVKLLTLGTTLRWWNPPGTAQVHLRVTPVDQDGPGINMILGSPITSFTVPEPGFGDGNYTILPGMTYRWQARVTSRTVPATETEGGWGMWSDPYTFQTRTTSSNGISLEFPTDRSSVATRTPVLRWSNSDTGVFYYEVQLSADPAFNADPVTASAAVYWNLVHGGVSSPANSYTVPPAFALSPATTYYWRVRARIQGDGVPVPWSEASSFRTP